MLFFSNNRKTTELNPKQISGLAFHFIFYRFWPFSGWFSVAWQRGLPWKFVGFVLSNKQRSFEPFVCFDCLSHCLFFPLESFVHVICKCRCIFPFFKCAEVPISINCFYKTTGGGRLVRWPTSSQCNQFHTYCTPQWGHVRNVKHVWPVLLPLRSSETT